MKDDSIIGGIAEAVKFIYWLFLSFIINIFSENTK